jgi:transposase InsO family protein
MTNNGGEFCSIEFDRLCKENNIEIYNTNPIYTPQKNGVAKCMSMTLMDMAGSMLSGAGLKQKF